MNTKNIIIITIITAFLGGAVFFFSQKEAEIVEVTKEGNKRVLVEQVSRLQNSGESIVAYGQVVSTTGVDVVPEVGGVVKQVYRKLGDVVQPGTLVVELQNASQLQAVYQAQASVASAEASLQKVQKGTDSNTITNLEITLASAKTNLTQAKNTLETNASSILASVGSSMQSQLDASFFLRGTEDSVELKILADPVSAKYPINEKRRTLQTSYNKAIIGDTSYDDVVLVLQQYSALVTNLITHVNSMSESNLPKKDEYLTTLRAIKQQIDGHEASLIALKASVTAAEQAIKTAENNLENANEDPDTQDVAIAKSQVAQAKASLSSAQIAYNKTRITAPVFGKISSIDVRVGELVGQSQPIFTIANENTLRVDTKVTQAESRKIKIGESVLIDNQYEGVVSVVSPSIDSQTGKVTVQVLLRDQDVRLASGAGVGLVFSPTENTQATQDIRVPIEAVFVRDEIAYVYLLVEDKAVPQVIESPSLFGKEVVITGGLEPTDIILLSARGVKDNQTVEVITQE